MDKCTNYCYPTQTFLYSLQSYPLCGGIPLLLCGTTHFNVYDYKIIELVLNQTLLYQ